MLGKDFICPSNLPYVAPVLIIKKLKGGLQVCVYYCAVNTLTIKNWNIFFLIWKTFTCFSSAKIYSKFDIIVTFNKIYIQEGDEEKTTFHARYGLYKYIVIFFGLYNIPETFQSYINKILWEFLDNFYIAYLDDILI